jgi:hypothetical protein
VFVESVSTGLWRRSQDAAATPYSAEGAVDYPMAYHGLALTLTAIAPTPVGAGTVTRMKLDEFRHCALRRNGGAPPPRERTVPPLQGISKDLGFDGPR